MGRPYEDLKTIVCHLGNGSSVTAVLNGKSVDTSMGLTPLEGVVMGNSFRKHRSGDHGVHRTERRTGYRGRDECPE